MTSKDHYRSSGGAFSLFKRQGDPAWRPPQLGALGALTSYWSLPHPQPALISMPTGAGKTAVALAAPYLASPIRVLVVVPSRELRRQISSAFREEAVLVRIGALSREAAPVVEVVEGRVSNWSDLEHADVVVAIPNSISPSHYPGRPPPANLFDLIIADEAHHAPAPTWRAILDHFVGAKALLLTATPYRRDGQRLPGSGVYQYPLREALEQGIYKPIRAMILAPRSLTSRAELDAQIADQVVQVLQDPEHATSTIMIRAATRARAIELAALYHEHQIPTKVLHSALAVKTQRSIVDELRDGRCRAVAVVGMLVEGFDLPSLRILAYHDKHKSLPATAQLVGRLARVDVSHPQASVVVTVRDVDVYPELQGAVRRLYEEDADWAAVLPGIIDDEVAEDIANRSYVSGFAPSPPELSLEAVNPLRRATIFELPSNAPVPAAFADGAIREELQAGKVLRGQSVLYAHADRVGQTLMVVTEALARPRWHDEVGSTCRHISFTWSRSAGRHELSSRACSSSIPTTT